MKIVELLPSKIYELKLLPVKYLKCSFNSFDGSCSLHFIHTILYGRFRSTPQTLPHTEGWDELQTMKVWSIKEQRIKAERRLDGTRKTWYMWMWIIILVIFISLLFTFSTSHITHHITGTMMMWYVRRRIEIERFFYRVFAWISPPRVGARRRMWNSKILYICEIHPRKKKWKERKIWNLCKNEKNCLRREDF